MTDVDEAVWADRVRGCLLGGALGDALGAPFEGWPQVTADALERHLGSDRPLTWTDDTALQLAAAAYLATLGDLGAFDDGEHARVLAEAWAAAPDRGYGPTPPRIFRTVLAGGDWRAAACEAFGGSGSLGNGGAMRAAPVGAVAGSAEAVAALGRRMAAVTHAHPVGQDGAAVMALAARTALAASATEPLRAEDLLAACLAHAETVELRTALAAVRRTLDMEDPGAAGAVTGNSVAAHESVAAALSAFLHHPREPVDAIRYAVHMGGDVDTIAAMAGALAGAAAGAGTLPARLLARLESRTRIEAVADGLATRSRSGGTPGASAGRGQ